MIKKLFEEKSNNNISLDVTGVFLPAEKDLYQIIASESNPFLARGYWWWLRDITEPVEGKYGVEFVNGTGRINTAGAPPQNTGAIVPIIEFTNISQPVSSGDILSIQGRTSKDENEKIYKFLVLNDKSALYIHSIESTSLGKTEDKKPDINSITGPIFSKWFRTTFINKTLQGTVDRR